MADEFTLKLNYPLTEEEWDLILDADLDNTPSMMFHTKHGKDVEYVKVVRCKNCKKQKTCKFAQYQGNNGFCLLAE